jgi:poly(ribitol-phosphate) beta-N-acetylglucosaminyltransferase
MNELTLSICIPTYNRGRYLSVLLSILSESLKNIKYNYSIIISNNSSSDNTEEVVNSFINLLPIKYFKQVTNIGPENNMHFCVNQVQSEFFMYLADDDVIDVDGLNKAIALLIRNPEVIALYAPWRFFDMQSQTDNGSFYYQSNDVEILKGDFTALVNHVFSNNIWPEISIVRTSLFVRAKPQWNELAYWASTTPCDYLNIGNIIFASTPFYITITNYFPDHINIQFGHVETESGWDRYRGGWEYMLGRASSNLGAEEIKKLLNDINKMVIDRMAVALRLRWHGGKDPIDTYYLACRLRGLGVKGEGLDSPNLTA